MIPPEAPPEEPPPPRYVTVMGENGLRRIVRSDGATFGVKPKRKRRVLPRRELPALNLRRFEQVQVMERVLERASKRRTITPHAVALPDDVDPASLPTSEDVTRRRIVLGLSQRALSDATGISRSMVQAIEFGRRQGLWARWTVGKALDQLELLAGVRA